MSKWRPWVWTLCLAGWLSVGFQHQACAGFIENPGALSTILHSKVLEWDHEMPAYALHHNILLPGNQANLVTALHQFFTQVADSNPLVSLTAGVQAQFIHFLVPHIGIALSNFQTDSSEEFWSLVLSEFGHVILNQVLTENNQQVINTLTQHIATAQNEAVQALNAFHQEFQGNLQLNASFQNLAARYEQLKRDKDKADEKRKKAKERAKSAEQAKRETEERLKQEQEAHQKTQAQLSQQHMYNFQLRSSIASFSGGRGKFRGRGKVTGNPSSSDKQPSATSPHSPHCHHTLHTRPIHTHQREVLTPRRCWLG